MYSASAAAPSTAATSATFHQLRRSPSCPALARTPTSSDTSTAVRPRALRLAGSLAGTLGKVGPLASTLSLGSSSTQKMSRNEVGATTKVVLSLAAAGMAPAVLRWAGLFSGAMERLPVSMGVVPGLLDADPVREVIAAEREQHPVLQRHCVLLQTQAIDERAVGAFEILDAGAAVLQKDVRVSPRQETQLPAVLVLITRERRVVLADEERKAGDDDRLEVRAGGCRRQREAGGFRGATGLPARGAISTRYESTPPKQISSPSRSRQGVCATAVRLTVVPFLLSRSAR